MKNMNKNKVFIKKEMSEVLTYRWGRILKISFWLLVFGFLASVVLFVYLYKTFERPVLVEESEKTLFLDKVKIKEAENFYKENDNLIEVLKQNKSEAIDPSVVNSYSLVQ